MQFDRYQRQMLLPQIGEQGQRRLGQSRALLVGCGALGSVIAEQLVRAGVGHLRIADRDIVELSNLQRQVLFDESDARDALPKAAAAARRLAQINSQVQVEAEIVDVDGANVERLARGCDVILDGTDNIETRYLLNDFSVKHSVPWIYSACVGTEGRVMTIVPGQTPCLRCIFPEPPAASELPTCDTAGVLGPVASVVGSLQAIAAIKLLSGNLDAVSTEMLTLEMWSNRIRSIDLRDAKRADCETCARRKFPFLESSARDVVTRLCGRNAVQVRPAGHDKPLGLESIESRLSRVGRVSRSEYLVRCELPESLQLTVFGDGRMIVHGTGDAARARSLYARYLGA
jgi:adenylyltransferase/sulfurtransferase